MSCLFVLYSEHIKIENIIITTWEYTTVLYTRHRAHFTWARKCLRIWNIFYWNCYFYVILVFRKYFIFIVVLYIRYYSVPLFFSRGSIECKEPIEVVSYKIGVCKVSPKGKDCTTIFQKLGFNGKTSVVLCKPRTGRMHQIRVHLQFLGECLVNGNFVEIYDA